MIQRLRSRPQFQAALAGATVAKTPHFVLHRLSLDAGAVEGPHALFAPAGPWLGVLIPKRWAKRAVTRNAIRRQIYTTAPAAEALPAAAHVVRLRSAFDPKQFVSASSDALKRAVRAELLSLWSRVPAPGTARAHVD